MLTYNERPRQIHSSSHESVVLHNLNTSARVEHDHNLRLVEDVCGRVHCHSVEVLVLQTLSVKVDPAVVGEHVQAVPPLRVSRPQTHFNWDRGVTSSNDGRQLGCSDLSVLVPVDLFEAALNV